jgi:hypothetical protein
MRMLGEIIIIVRAKHEIGNQSKLTVRFITIGFWIRLHFLKSCLYNKNYKAFRYSYTLCCITVNVAKFSGKTFFYHSYTYTIMLPSFIYGQVRNLIFHGLWIGCIQRKRCVRWFYSLDSWSRQSASSVLSQ